MNNSDHFFNQDKIQIVIQRGIALIELKKYEKAIIEFQKGLLISPLNDRLTSQIALCYYLLGKPNEALVSAKLSISKNPLNDFAHYTLGLTYLFLKDFNSSLKHFNTALELSPNNEYYLTALARYYGLQNKIEDSQKCLDLALSENPENHDALMMKALYANEKGAKKEASYYVEQLLRVEPNSASGLEVAGMVNDKIGHAKDAAYFYQQSLKNNPKEDVAIKHLNAKVRSKTFISIDWFSKPYVLWALILSIVFPSATIFGSNSILTITFLTFAFLIVFITFALRTFYAKNEFRQFLIFEDNIQGRNVVFYLAIALLYLIYIITDLELFSALRNFVIMLGVIVAPFQE
ncbi:MAG: tetratricopeptide repeat protein [Saprospiraceae bacterium]